MKLQTINSEAQRVAELLRRGIQSWYEAGEIVAREVDKDPSFVDAVCEAFPEITAESVMRFYDIGKKRLRPELLLSSSPGCKRLARLPYELQSKYVAEPVEVLICADGTWETLKVDVRNLTKDQAEQAINCDRVRTPAEQRAWIEAKRTASAAPKVAIEAPYKVIGRKVVFRRDVTVTAKELATILASME